MSMLPDVCPKCGKYHHGELAHRDTDPSGSIDLVINAYDENRHEPMDTIEDIKKKIQDEISTVDLLEVKQ